MAQAYFSPSRPDCAALLLKQEAQARDAQRGLWARPDYALRKADQLQSDLGTFQIVEGLVQAMAIKSRRAFLNFGPDWQRDFTITVAPDDMKLFRQRKLRLNNLAGKRVRVRGIIGDYRGPQIELAVPEHLEVLDPDPPKLKKAKKATKAKKKAAKKKKARKVPGPSQI